jgi:hypothetical protein
MYRSSRNSLAVSRTARGRRRSGLAIRPAQMGVDARDQLLRAERLDDVVVGAEFEAADAIRFFAARGEHDDRRRRRARILADGLAHEQTVHAGQHEVEQDQIGRLRRQPRHHLRSRRHDIRRMSGAFEVVRDQLGDIRVILDDEDARHLRTPAAPGRGRRG